MEFTFENQLYAREIDSVSSTDDGSIIIVFKSRHPHIHEYMEFTLVDFLKIFLPNRDPKKIEVLIQNM